MFATGQLVGGRTAVSLNGGALTTPVTYAAYSGTGTTYLGAQITGTDTYPYSGLAMEIIIYNRALNQSQINLVRGYLAWKWNLTNLITQLPYTSTYPIAFPLPNTYSGLALWFDSADLTTLFQNTAGTTAVTANGQNVQCWRDKSGNSRHAILFTGTTGPTYSSNAFNGSYPGILFNGTTSSILMTSAFVPSGNLNPLVLEYIIPSTSNFCDGDVVPTPTFPEELMRILSNPDVKNRRLSSFVPAPFSANIFVS
jgi:hypothetical protein